MPLDAGEDGAAAELAAGAEDPAAAELAGPAEETGAARDDPPAAEDGGAAEILPPTVAEDRTAEGASDPLGPSVT